MTGVEEEQQQDRVIDLVNQIMVVLAGQDDAEATTALTLAVVTTIVAHAKDDYADRRDIVDWIKAGKHHTPPVPERTM